MRITGMEAQKARESPDESSKREREIERAQARSLLSEFGAMAFQRQWRVVQGMWEAWECMKKTRIHANVNNTSYIHNSGVKNCFE